ncbi:MAG: HEAT repeat domain-containing protein [Fimbriimonadales bacterium]|nr:HEAT repeat domain-containing protein [Fimbriimonadales bacterium]MDW8052851.1 HEAT repeat domain-containing protein [Armatimonadota bacterium]
MEQQAVEVEVVVPCVEGQQHRIRLRILSWGEWQVAYIPCEVLLGRAFGLMASCSHYARKNRNQLKLAVAEQSALAGAPTVPALIEALRDGNWEVRRAAAEALGKIGDARAVPALRVHAELLAEARQALQQLGATDFLLTQAVQTLAQRAQ